MRHLKKNQYTTCFLLLINLILILTLNSCLRIREPDSAMLLIENKISTPEAMYEIYSYSVQDNGNNLVKLVEFSRKNVYWLSPNGQHLALLTPWEADGLDRPQHSLTVIDLLTNESIDQIEDVGRYNSERNWAFVSDESLVWSPKGDKFVFERNSVGGQGVDLWVYDLNNSSTNALTMDESINWHPAWSQDGERIAFTSRKPCGKAIGECSPEEEYWDIVIVNVDGTNDPIHFGFKDKGFFVDDHYIVKSLCNLQWSPTGNQIALENRCLGRGETEPHDVFILDLQTDQIHSVTNFDKSPSSSSIFDYNYDLTWNPAGDELYIGYSKRDILNNSFSRAGGVLIIDARTFDSVSTAEIFGLQTHRGWSSDMTLFVGFTKQHKNEKLAPGPVLLSRLNESADLTILENSRHLPYGSCDVPLAHWSPDDLFVAYAVGDKFGDCVDEASRREINVVSIDNGDVLRVPLKGDIRPIGWLKK